MNLATSVSNLLLTILQRVHEKAEALQDSVGVMK